MQNIENNFTSGDIAYKLGNNKELVKRLHQAAERGHSAVLHMLGMSYGYGIGVAQNYETAVYWFRKAAEQGHAGAQNELGMSYIRGEGVPQDYKTAYMWLLLARKNGGVEIQETTRGDINWLEPRLSRAEIAAAQDEAAEMQAQIESRK